MQKLTSIILLTAVLALSGCQRSNNLPQHGTNQTTGVGDILAAATAESTSETSVVFGTIPSTEDTNPYDISSRLANGAEGVDIDLTVLSSNMIYSEVFAMVYAPEEYMGMTIKMEGIFSYMHDETTGNTYYACIVQDATQCCAQGIEFVPSEEYEYPDDFPEVGENICVIGVFDTYMEGDAQYITLKDAELVKDN